MKAFVQHGSLEGDKGVLQALVPFVLLKDSVLFTCKGNPNDDDAKVNTESNYKYYQRRIDLSRIKKIEDFIIDSILDERDNIILATLFPSSMILAINDDENEVKHDPEDAAMCSLKLSRNVFIVDGQHRMMAMMRVYNRLLEGAPDMDNEDRKYVLQYIENYKFNCTILVNYDLWEQGQVFINVNFKQKPVNKSLYYEIFGSEYRESKSDWKRNQTYLAHCLARSLNENHDSPYLGKVKMLGTGKGYISQAFIVESLLQHFRKNGIWEYNTNSSIRDVDISYFSTELISYFFTIRTLFDTYWPKDDMAPATRICKSTAFGAFVRLMGDVREMGSSRLVNALKESSLEDKLCDYYMNHVKKIFAPIVKHSEKLFGNDSEFSNGSGKGTESKLYKMMVYLIHQTHNVDNSIPAVLNLDDISMQLQEYLWTHPIDDLDPLAYSYDVEELQDLKIKSYSGDKGSYRVETSFYISVTLHMDNEDYQGFAMTFPATCKCSLVEQNGKIVLKEDNLSIVVDTDNFYN